jgi:biopolymer transport protein ExbD
MIASTLAKQLDTIQVKLPQAKGKTENRQSISVTINSDNRFFIDENQVPKNSLESELVALLRAREQNVIVLRAENTISINEVVYVMNIANKNGIEIILAVDAN